MSMSEFMYWWGIMQAAYAHNKPLWVYRAMCNCLYYMTLEEGWNT